MDESQAELRGRLAALWSEVLEVPEVTEGDNFFSLGGDSLKATAIMVYVEEQFGVLLDPIELFDAPEFGFFCLAVEDVLGSEASGVITI